MKPTEFVSRKPNQHEDQAKLLKELLQGQKQLLKAVGEGAGKPIDIQFSWPMDHALMQKVTEILEVVKDIQGRLQGGSGLSEAQEQALAGQLHTGSEALQGAVDAANQRNPTEVP